MKILVTGATGFLGASVVRALLADKNVVRVIIRKSSDLSNIEGLNVEKVLADLEDENSLQLALDGCQALFHVAADYKLWVPNPEAMYRTNVLGTKKLMSAALKARVSRIVYTSSVAVLGKCNGNQNADEDTPVQFKDMIGHYKKSKFLAEEEVKKMVKDDGLPAIIVNPSTPVGVRDIKPTPTGKIIVDFLNGKMPAYVDTGLNIVHVEDCAIGHLLAFKLGQIGERYILGGENMTLQNIFITLSNLSNRRAPKVNLPQSYIMPFAYFSEFMARMLNIEARLTVDALRMSENNMYFSSKKAINSLGYTFRPANDAFRDSVRWFYDNGYTKLGLK